MLESQREQDERKRVLDNKVQQGSTFHQHAQADADIPRGRFSAVTSATVVGSTAVPQYPAAAAHQADPCGPEPSLGYRIDELEPAPAVQATDPTSADAPSTPLGQRADVGSLSSGDPGDGVVSQPSKHAPGRAPGSPVPTYRRR